MAAKINLLPIELSAESNVAKLAELIKRISLLGFVLFVVLAFATVAFILITFFQVRNSTNRQEVLKANIAALEQTEQRLFLVRDRLAKIKNIRAQKSALENLTSLEKILVSVPTNISFSEIQVDKDKIELSFIATNSVDLTIFLSTVMSQDVFEKILLKNFNLNPSSGYLVTLEIY